MKTHEQAGHELTLVLLYLNSWIEKREQLRRAWKGFRFEDLDWLEEAGLLWQGKRAKSAYLTEEGEAKARELLAELGLGHLVEEK